MEPVSDTASQCLTVVIFRAVSDTCLGESNILLSMNGLVNFSLRDYHFVTVCRPPREVYIRFQIY